MKLGKRRIFRRGRLLVEIEPGMMVKPYVNWMNEGPQSRFLSFVFGKRGVDHVALLEFDLSREEAGVKGAGLKPPQSGLLRKEVIGNEDCPLLHRWTLLDAGQFKVLLHHFLPNSDDKDMHDHPRSFWTLILKGSYEDLVPCPECMGVQPSTTLSRTVLPCAKCSTANREWRGYVVNEVMRPFTLRYRNARHAHRTRTGPEGCWTVVVMGPKRRAWGFWRDGNWWPWKLYENYFGLGMRCDTDDD